MAHRYTDEELEKMVKSPGWSHSLPQQDRATGTLEDVAKLSHAHHRSMGTPGLVRQAETAIELDLIQLEKLWRYLGLPV